MTLKVGKAARQILSRKFAPIRRFPYRSPLLPKILDIFKGGGSVQNLDPSGACGGLFKKINFTLHITVQSLDFIQNYKL